MAAEEFRGLGKGTFGCVVDPALSNTIKGKEYDFPGEVTKIMKRNENRNKTVNNSAKVFKITGNEGHDVIAYQKNFKVKNLSKKVKNYCKFKETYVNKNTGATLNTPIYPVHMKNLGVSIEDLSEPKNAGIIASLRALPFSTILKQITKLIYHVKSINNAGLIHGDIRQTNIMVKNDGTLTLIDFDWLLPKNMFFTEYNHAFGFYNNPPESILLHNYDFSFYVLNGTNKYIEKSGDDKTKIITKFKNLNIKYLNKYKTDVKIDGKTYLIINEKIRKIKNAFKLLTIYERNIDVHIENIEKIIDNYDTTYIDLLYEELFDIIAPTFDSYGLAFTILEFLNIIYEGSYFADNDAIKYILLETDKSETDANKLFTLINVVLKPMADFDLKKRKTIYAILPLIDALSASKGGRHKQYKQRTRRRYKRA